MTAGDVAGVRAAAKRARFAAVEIDGRRVGGKTLKSVLLYFTNAADNNTGEAYPSARTVADAIQSNEKTVRYAIKALVRLGWLEPTGRKAGRAARYVVTPGSDREPRAPTPGTDPGHRGSDPGHTPGSSARTPRAVGARLTPEGTPEGQGSDSTKPGTSGAPANTSQSHRQIKFMDLPTPGALERPGDIEKGGAPMARNYNGICDDQGQHYAGDPYYYTLPVLMTAWQHRRDTAVKTAVYLDRLAAEKSGETFDADASKSRHAAAWIAANPKPTNAEVSAANSALSAGAAKRR